jgi:hypothetical protein
MEGRKIVTIAHRPPTRSALPVAYRWAIPILAAVVLLAGCAAAGSRSPEGSSGAATSVPATTSTSVPTAEATATPDLASPVGIIAMGHSGLTGEGTAGLSHVAFENSWATGTSPAVNSIYLRLTVARPETQGHVANTASGGAPASLLKEQTQRALRMVPVPALAIISTLDNDIRCDGTDPDHVSQFGAFVATALDMISKASPNAQILVIGQLGRPSPAFVEALVAADPTAKASMTGAGICDFYDPAGNLVEKNFETLTGIIDAYEAEQARVCALVLNCHTDDGARAAYVDRLENFGIDMSHLNVAGQAAEAENLWPVVARVLGL